MKFKIDKNSPVPLYKQLADAIKIEIDSGGYAPEDKLPTEADMSSELALSLGTVKRAYGMLANEGRIRKIRGSGSYVKKVPGTDAEQMEPKTILSRMFEALSKEKLSVHEGYLLARQITREVYSCDKKVVAALVDCNYETLNGIISTVENIKHLEVKAYRTEELLSGQVDLSTECDFILTTQHHYAQLVPYADKHHIKMEQLVLRESRDLIVNLTILPDERPIVVLYRSAEFLESVQYTLDILRKKMKVIYGLDGDLREDLEQYCREDCTFILPPDYLENSSARTLQIVSRARKCGSTIILFCFEVDSGSLIHLEQIVQEIELQKGDLMT